MELRGVGDGREGDRPVSGTVADGSQGLATADESWRRPGSGRGGTVLLLAQGWTACGHGGDSGKGPTQLLADGRRPSAREGLQPDIRADRWFPPALDQAQQEELTRGGATPPASSGIGMANWYWKVVRRFASERLGIELSRSSCLNLCTAWDLPSSGPRSGCSRLMRPSGRLARGGVRRPEGGGPTD